MSSKKVLHGFIAVIINSLVFVGRNALFPFEKLFQKRKLFIKAVIKKYRKIYKSLLVEVTKARASFISLISLVKNFPRKIKLMQKSKTAKKVRRVLKSNRKYAPFLLGVIFSALFIYTPFRVYSWYRDLPRPELLSQVNHKSTRILDREGRLLYEIYVDKNYEPVPLNRIPQYVIQTTLAIEDRGFYSHMGIDFRAMLRAAWSNIFNGGLQGGSTITQQLVKNVLLDPERTVSRKTKEIIVALMAERVYTKDQILEMYLNNISYGGTAWGVQSAAQKFFGKNVDELGLAEAAFLAGLPSAPSSFSPFSGNAAVSKQRQGQVLEQMVELRYITREEADQASAEPLNFSPQTEYIRAPHFVNYIRDQLERELGTRLVNLGGLTVTTTLDLDLQDKVQEIVSSEVETNSYLNFSNGAALVLDSKSGEILS